MGQGSFTESSLDSTGTLVILHDSGKISSIYCTLSLLLPCDTGDRPLHTQIDQTLCDTQYYWAPPSVPFVREDIVDSDCSSLVCTFLLCLWQC